MEDNDIIKLKDPDSRSTSILVREAAANAGITKKRRVTQGRDERKLQVKKNLYNLFGEMKVLQTLR